MGSSPLATTAGADMKWAFPELHNPTIIDLNKTGGQDYWQFRPDEDVIFIGPKTPRTESRVQTDGGHNIVMLGGEFAPQAGANKGATLHFLNLYGAVHVEGAHIDSHGASQDGIAVAGAHGHQPDVTIQNTLVEGVHGAKDDIHADVFQTHGSVGDIRMYNVTGETNYQGVFIAPQYDPAHKSADLENVNMKWMGGGQEHSYQYWFLDSKDEHAFPVTLKNVFTTEKPGQHAEEDSAWPKASLSDTTHSVRDGNSITWPGLPYKGAMTVGSPPGGDFAKAGDTGGHYAYKGGLPLDGHAAPVTGGPVASSLHDAGTVDTSAATLAHAAQPQPGEDASVVLKQIGADFQSLIHGAPNQGALVEHIAELEAKLTKIAQEHKAAQPAETHQDQGHDAHQTQTTHDHWG